MKASFEWKKTNQLSLIQILLAFFLPSSFAFFGFRVVLPWLVDNGYPKTLMWGVVASIMLFIFVILGVFLINSESKKLNISFFQRLCLKKIPAKQWLICLGIMILGIILSFIVTSFIEPFKSFTGLHVPDYMPFWLDPSINPLETDMEILSPGYPLKGNYILVVCMGITLLLNILAEEIYFRAWLLPKMQSLGKWSWVANGVLFALYHTFQLWLFPMLIVVSLTTALIIYLSKSLWPAIVMHIVANFLLAIVGILILVFG